MTRRRLRRIAILLGIVATVMVTWHLLHVTIDWYPAMGVHAVNVIVGHHYCYAGWVQHRPGQVVWQASCNAM